MGVMSRLRSWLWSSENLAISTLECDGEAAGRSDEVSKGLPKKQLKGILKNKDSPEKPRSARVSFSTPERPPAESRHDLQQPDQRLTGKPHQLPRSLVSAIVGDGVYKSKLQILHSTLLSIQPKSATPVSVFLDKKLSEAEMITLIEDAHVAFKKHRTARGTKLWAKIEEAHNDLALYLGDHDLADVDIIYPSSPPGLKMYIDDRARLTEAGGRAYHCSWRKEDVQAKTMSVIIDSGTLLKLFPPQKLADGVRIEINTEPATRASPGWEHPGTIFPSSPPSLINSVSTKSSEPSSTSCVSRSNKFAQQSIKHNPKEAVRSNRLNVIREAPKKPWNIWRTSTRIEKPQPIWHPENAPFTKYNTPNNDQWWINDFITRKAMIDDWVRRTYKPRLGYNPFGFMEHRLTDHPETAVRGKDFEVMEGLCDTYPWNRNYAWWEEHVKPLMDKEEELKREGIMLLRKEARARNMGMRHW